jgi:hypothetical protein
MTTRNQNSIRFNVSKSHGWNDLFVVASLAIVLGAFVAQISSTPKHSSGSLPMAAASATVSQSG